MVKNVEHEAPLAREALQACFRVYKDLIRLEQLVREGRKSGDFATLRI